MNLSFQKKNLLEERKEKYLNENEYQYYKKETEDLDNYIKTNHIDIITLTTYKRNIFSRLFNPGIARKMIFHSDTPLLDIYGRPS